MPVNHIIKNKINMSKRKLVMIIAGVLFIAYITTFNYGGCGGSSLNKFRGSGSSAPQAPSVTTITATNITYNSATLNGTVNPNRVNVTSCYFDYGTSESYGNQQNVASLPGSGSSPISVTANVSSLSISTTYNFRIVATNAGGTTNGLNQTFTTNESAVDDYVWVANWYSADVTRILKSDLSTTTITVGTYPSGPFGVAVDGTYCWVTNYSSNNVTRIKKSDLSTTTIAVESGPYGVAVDETYCWVANYSSNNVTRIKKSDLSTTTIAVGTAPEGVAVDGTYCWVSNWGSANVTRIVKSTLDTTTIVAGTQTEGIAVDETYCWAANPGSHTVTRIKKSDLTTTTIAVESGEGVAVDETYCWVTNYNSAAVTRIKKSDLTMTTIGVESYPWGVAVDALYCWVTNNTYSGNVTRIVKSTLATTNIAVGRESYSLGDMTGYAYDNYSRVP
jgi:hypothetical protein